MSASPQSTPEGPPQQTSGRRPPDSHLNIDSQQNHQPVERNFRYPLYPNEKDIPRRVHPFPTSKEGVARKLQRIDILLNLVYSRVANDRSLKALLPDIPEHKARNLVSNFAYVRHQQDTQELKSEMTDKQTYRIFRHHYRAEQRLADALRDLRRATTEISAQKLSETSPDSKSMENTSPFTQPVADLENDTAQMRMRYLQQVQSELSQMSGMYGSDDDLLYIQEFSQAQQINTMQARCVAMKDEYEADDMRRGRSSWEVGEIRKAPKDITGPEDWEEDPPQSEAVTSNFPALGLLNGEWTPPDPPRLPCPNPRLSHKAVATDAKFLSSANAVYMPDAYARENVSLASSREYRQRRSRRHPDSDLPQKRHQRRDRKTYRNENHERPAQIPGRSERRDRRGSSSRMPFTVTSPKRISEPYLEDYGPRQQRYSTSRPPLPSHHQGRRPHLETHTPQFTSKRPGRSQRTLRTQVTPKYSSATANQLGMGNDIYYDANTEFATMPNLRRTSHGYHRASSYDDSYMPLQGGSGQNHGVGDHSSGPFRKPFPHESADAFGWKPPEGTTGTHYDSGLMIPGEERPLYPQPGDPQFPPNLSAPRVPQGGFQSQAVGEHMPVPRKTRKRDEWRYNSGLGFGPADMKEGVGVFQNIAKKVKGRKEKPRVPHNPIEAVQMARKDPVKFMTTMVAGELLPQAKRKAHKFESMLGKESHADGVQGPVGKVLGKVAKESMAHGSSSKTGVQGQVGQVLAKMALDSAIGGGSSKGKVGSQSKADGLTGQVGKVLTKVAKESMGHGSSSKTGVQGQVGQALAKVALDSALGGGSSKGKVGSHSKADGVTGQVGKMLTKVAKESMGHGSSSKTGVQGQVGQALAKVALDAALGGGSSKGKVGSHSKADGVTGQVGKMLTKVAKESMGHGSSSKTGVQGQVGQMLAKMTLDSAMGGGSSKGNVSSQVGNVLTKVAKETAQQAGASSSGTKMIKQVMNSLANA